MTALDDLVEQFCDELAVDWVPPKDLMAAAADAVRACGCDRAYETARRRRDLIALVNTKFGFNDSGFQYLVDMAARQRVVLNYHDKVELRDCLDHEDLPRLERWLTRRGLPSNLRELAKPLQPVDTIRQLHDQLNNPTIARSDARQCHPAERRESILRSLFGSFIFRSFPSELMHAHLNSDCGDRYFPDFYDHLLYFHPSVLHRQRALVFAVIDASVRERLGVRLRDSLMSFVAKTYDELSNHCYFAILIKPFREGNEDGQWRLFSDLVLYAEKFRETQLKTGYFNPTKIEAATRLHIPHLRPAAAQFNVANEGFFFRDSYVLPQHVGEVQTTDAPCDLLLMFQKNERDETLVPCPACRSRDARGNSYPSLGVKSWECQNLLCPERSAFDRGNRYSVASLIKRRAIASEDDQIPEESLRRWKLDVVPGTTEADIAEMLLRHFSLHGDTVLFVNTADHGGTNIGRRIDYCTLDAASEELQLFDKFERSSFFARFALERPETVSPDVEAIPTGWDDVVLYRGDAFDALAALGADTVDGAVTSPPYYNARSYSVWPNIYCYLHDMYNIARQVFRVLRPGAYFLFNVFDYFDNEHTIVSSAMGKKRMILGAYIINLFRRIGFEIDGNTVWYKGEIEGKRNFNQGNNSPYYQLPFNCWEHILLFRKPDKFATSLDFPTVLAARPVMKMVRGQNILGHSAPYPPEIPKLLLTHMKPGALILDPFSGSMTTGRTAHRLRIGSVSIELHREYCDLGVRLLNGEMNAVHTLFDFDDMAPSGG